MGTAAAPRGRSSRALEGLSWAGLVAGLFLIASACSAPRWPVVCAASAFGPAEVTAWAQALAGAIGALAAALNGVAIVWHRRGKPPRRPRTHRGDAGKPAEGK